MRRPQKRGAHLRGRYIHHAPVGRLPSALYTGSPRSPASGSAPGAASGELEQALGPPTQRHRAPSGGTALATCSSRQLRYPLLGGEPNPEP